jgi:phage tail tape-measure protein
VNATRLVVAEKLEKGQISPAEAKQQIAEEVSRAVSEMESRRTANRVAAAMETAPTPRTCYRFSNGAATCF